MKMMKETQKIIRIVYWGDDGRRRTEFFANVDVVTCDQVDSNLTPQGKSNIILDQYADHDENRLRALRTAGSLEAPCESQPSS